MDLQQFFALRTGEIALPDGQPAELIVEELGALRVPSGRLAICDAIWLECPIIVPIPSGNHAVRLTSAIVPETYDVREKREAYLSVICSEAQSVTVGPAEVEPDSIDWGDVPSDGIGGIAGLFTVPTPMSNVVVVDARAIRQGMPEDPDTWYDTVVAADDTGWFPRMDTEEARTIGALNAELPRAIDHENAVIVIARREQHYPVLETRDAEGHLTGIHVDLLVVGELSELLNAFDGRDPDAIFEAEERERIAREAEIQANRPGFFARLVGRG